MADDWRRLNNEELHKCYVSPNIIRLIESRRRISGACGTHGRDDDYIQHFSWKN
jgi:hypothetical protein